jgi:MFS family permease
MIGVCICTGFALSGIMGLAFFSTHTNAQWRGPLGLGMVFPVFMLFVISIAPESPRFLLLKGHHEEARTIVMKLHHVSGDADQEYARREFFQMQKQIDYDRSLTPSWKQMFLRPSYRKRVLIAISFAFITQSRSSWHVIWKQLC